MQISGSTTAASYAATATRSEAKPPAQPARPGVEPVEPDQMGSAQLPPGVGENLNITA
jgi:hypothetical protein